MRQFQRGDNVRNLTLERVPQDAIGKVTEIIDCSPGGGRRWVTVRFDDYEVTVLPTGQIEPAASPTDVSP